MTERPIPPDFPRFVQPENADAMNALRRMFWRHFLPYGPAWDDWLRGDDFFPQYPSLPSGPKASLWDEWLAGGMLWPAIETDGIRADAPGTIDRFRSQRRYNSIR